MRWYFFYGIREEIKMFKFELGDNFGVKKEESKNGKKEI